MISFNFSIKLRCMLARLNNLTDIKCLKHRSNEMNKQTAAALPHKRHKYSNIIRSQPLLQSG